MLLLILGRQQRSVSNECNPGLASPSGRSAVGESSTESGGSSLKTGYPIGPRRPNEPSAFSDTIRCHGDWAFSPLATPSPISYKPPNFSNGPLPSGRGTRGEVGVIWDGENSTMLYTPRAAPVMLTIQIVLPPMSPQWNYLQIFSTLITNYTLIE